MSNRINSIEELAEAVKRLSGPIAVISHQKPDADAVGSAVGMVELLRARGLDAFGMTPDPVPEYLRFLLQDTQWREPDAKLLEGRTIISVDVPSKGRMGFDGANIKVSLAIDHHASHAENPFAENYYVEIEDLSASQIVSAVVRRLQDKINPVAAQALYSGILTDTINFTVGNGNTGMQRALHEASWLVGQGADALSLSQRFFGTLKKSYLKLLALSMERAEFLEGGKLLIVSLSQKEMEDIGVTEEDRTKVGSALVSIEGVEVSAFIRQAEDYCKGSLRGRRNEYRLDKLAEGFNGGGHMKASGIRGEAKEPLEVFLPRFKQALVLHWKTYGQTAR